MKKTYAMIVVCLVAAATIVPASSGQITEDFTNLTPALKQILVRRARQVIKTPDGRYWDGWGEFDYRRVYDRAIGRQPRSVRPKISGFIEDHTLGEHWRVNPMLEAEGWKIEVRYAGSATGSRWPDELPRLWTCMSPGDDLRERVVYVNENDRTKIQRDLDERFFAVSERLSPTRVEVRRVRVHPYHFHLKYVVEVPHKRIIHRKGYLTGEYVLWLADDHQMTDERFTPRRVWQYMPRDELKVTPGELHDAIASGRADLYQWDYSKGSDGEFSWVRKPVGLEYR